MLIKSKLKYRTSKPSGGGGIYVSRTGRGSGLNRQRHFIKTDKKLIKFVKSANAWCLTWFDKGIQKQEWQP